MCGKDMCNVPAGRWSRAPRRFKMQTHGGNVFIHVGVSQRCRAPDDEPTPVTLHAESKHTKRSSGALEERSGKDGSLGEH